MTGRPDWNKRNREAVLEVRRQSEEQLADWRQGPDTGLARLAKLLGITRQAVAFWNARVPVVHVNAINSILGIPKHELRGDRFSPQDDLPTKHKINGRKHKGNGRM